MTAIFGLSLVLLFLLRFFFLFTTTDNKTKCFDIEFVVVVGLDVL